MKDILILPPELRQISKQLLASAQKIDTALQAIDNDILALKGNDFLGHSADVFQTHYAAKRQSLLKAKEIVILFAGNLQTTADVFEQADAGTLTLASLSPSSTAGSVLGASTQASDPQKYNALLQEEKAQQARLAEWLKEHPDLSGWTLKEVNDAMAGVRRFIQDLERGIVDMKKPQDIGHLLMKLLTTADEDYIKSSEANIGQMQRLLQVYEARKELLIERAGMESQLAGLQQQKEATLAPYLAITDPASRTAWVDILPANMTKEFMVGPRTITNAPLQVPAQDLDRNSYTAILNQFVSSNENPRYARDSDGTYCDVYVRDVLRSMDVTVGNYGSINTIARDLGNNPQWEIISAEEAQSRANEGIPAVVLMDSSSHVSDGECSRGDDCTERSAIRHLARPPDRTSRKELLYGRG